MRRTFLIGLTMLMSTYVEAADVPRPWILAHDNAEDVAVRGIIAREEENVDSFWQDAVINPMLDIRETVGDLVLIRIAQQLKAEIKAITLHVNALAERVGSLLAEAAVVDAVVEAADRRRAGRDRDEDGGAGG